MNQINVEVACQSLSRGEQNVHAHSSPPLDGTVTTPIQDRGGPPHRILVVDDDSVVRQFCADALTSSGYLVDTARDGAAGWQALRQVNYDLLLTDNKMPMVSGIELVKKVRSARMDLPVVLATSAIPTEAIGCDSSLELAATLLKPFTIFELLDTVEKVLRANGRRNRPGMFFPMLAADAHQLSPVAQ